MRPARTLASVGASVLALAALTPFSSNANAAGATCAALATDSALGVKYNPAIKSVTAVITTTAAPASIKYCKVTLVYGTKPAQNITIAVGLPLNSADGGSGGEHGAWNGRTEGLGGGGCAGNLNVDAAVNGGYVGSGTDGGHS